MDVLVLAPYRFDTAPCQRFRIEQWMPTLERLGARFHFAPFASDRLSEILYRPGHTLAKVRAMLADLMRRLFDVVRARRYDVVFLHREAALIGPPVLERALFALGIPIVYDFDDAIYLPNANSSNKYFSALKFSARKTDRLCRLAAHVLVGNEVLRDYAVTRSDHVSVVPTTIDIDKYPLVCDYASDDLVIGWSGSHSSAAYLEELRPVFEQLRRKHKFRVEVIGADSFNMDSVEVRSRRWRAETEVEDLSGISIGVMPLPDDEWARGKCALKALQYMALGIPTVASPVGANRSVIGDGVDGLWAGSTDEWVQKLSALLDDAALRRRLGVAGRERVVAEYSAQVHAPRVFDILKASARGS